MRLRRWRRTQLETQSDGYNRYFLYRIKPLIGNSINVLGDGFQRPPHNLESGCSGLQMVTVVPFPISLRTSN